MKGLLCLAGGAAAMVLGSCTGGDPVAAGPAAGKVEAARIPAPAREAAAPERKSAPVQAPAPRKGEITRVNLQRVFELQGTGQMLLIDVRPTFHYNLGHIPGAIGMQKRTFEEKLPAREAELDAAVAAGKVIVLYCANEDCPDAHAAGKILARHGYSSSVYKGGWDEWKASGL